MKNYIKSIVLAATISIGLASCGNKNNEGENNVDAMTEMDSVSDTGSDGLGREIDTVQQIERKTEDSLMDQPAP